MATIHTTREALTAPGVVKEVSIELHEISNQVVLTIECSTEALADALYEELTVAAQNGPFRVGPLSLSSPRWAKEV